MRICRTYIGEQLLLNQCGSLFSWQDQKNIKVIFPFFTMLSEVGLSIFRDMPRDVTVFGNPG